MPALKKNIFITLHVSLCMSEWVFARLKEFPINWETIYTGTLNDQEREHKKGSN